MSLAEMSGKHSSRGRLSYTVVGGSLPPSSRTSSAGFLRVSVHANGQNFVEMDGHQEKESFVDMFLGRTSQKLENIQLTADVAEDILDVELIVDPPCIAPFEDEDAAGHRGFGGATGVAPQAYWKHFASWKMADPVLTGRREKAAKFVADWARTHKLEDLLKLETKPENIADLIQKKVSLKKKSKVLRSYRSGMLETLEGFVNISNFPVGIRKISSASEEHKTGDVVAPGECIMTDKIVDQDEVRFLRLADGRGWVFDQHGDLTVMAKMEDIEVGATWYRTICKELVEVRRSPCYEDEARTGRLLCHREMVVVNVKCRVRGQTFLHLADGAGWVFLAKASSTKDKRSSGKIIMEECDAEIVHGDQLLAQEDILPVTNDIVEVGNWTYTVVVEDLLAIGSKLHGVQLCLGDTLKVDKRCYANGTLPDVGQGSFRWVRIHDGRGWVPEKTVDGRMAIKLQAEGGFTYPVTFKDRNAQAAQKVELPKWAKGVA